MKKQTKKETEHESESDSDGQYTSISLLCKYFCMLLFTYCMEFWSLSFLFFLSSRESPLKKNKASFLARRQHCGEASQAQIWNCPLQESESLQETGQVGPAQKIQFRALSKILLFFQIVKKTDYTFISQA